MRVSHETIYRSPLVQTRGAFRHHNGPFPRAGGADGYGEGPAHENGEAPNSHAWPNKKARNTATATICR
jgi:hypothetical protein